MIIGIPKEIKPQETRMALTPKWVEKLTMQGHIVLVEKDLGINANASNEEYIDAGARLVESVTELYEACEFIVKVKDFTDEEIKILPFHEGQIIMTFLHLGENDPHPLVVNKLIEKKVKAIGLELMQNDEGIREVIKPMSQIAGNLAVVVAAHYSQFHNGGRGVSLIPLKDGKKAKILVLGGGNSGSAAIETALNIGCEVVVIQKEGKTFNRLKKEFPQLNIKLWSEDVCTEELKKADVVINAIYPVVGMKLPLITREMLKEMKPKSVLIDLAGCGIVETWRFTSIDDPIFWEENVLHYGVDNMPALVPETSCEALSNSIFKYVEAIANKGFEQACKENNTLRRGVCFYNGKIVNEDVAYTHKMSFSEFLGVENE